jgi:hypothetical protein
VVGQSTEEDNYRLVYVQFRWHVAHRLSLKGEFPEIWIIAGPKQSRLRASPRLIETQKDFPFLVNCVLDNEVRHLRCYWESSFEDAIFSLCLRALFSIL